MSATAPAGPGIHRATNPGSVRIAGRLLPGGPPDVLLYLDRPIDARELCDAWAVQDPVAVSPDVHQTTWLILIAAEVIPDPHNRRIASEFIASGRWHIKPRLATRPGGELPGVVSGASPAYDVRERGGQVVAIEIAPAALGARMTEPSDADARLLIDGMRARYTVWKGGGAAWEPGADAAFVIVFDHFGPAAGCALSFLEDGLAYAAKICFREATTEVVAGAKLLDVLEALARDHGCDRLRLDSSAFLADATLPYTAYGYRVGPPYEGDTDVEVWTERDLGR